VKLPDLTNPRLPLKKRRGLKLLNQYAPPPSAASPKSKRKKNDVEDSDASKPTEPAPEESSPEEEGGFNPYDDAGSVNS
jgi:hypothetical protein